MKYHFKIKKEKKGFSAECIELKGCLTEADSKQELLENISEALNLYLSEPFSSKLIFPKPKPSINAKNVIAMQVDPKVAFAMCLRQARVKKKLTQLKASQLLGFKNIWSYQKLEKMTANPTIETLAKVKEVFPEIKIDSLVS